MEKEGENKVDVTSNKTEHAAGFTAPEEVIKMISDLAGRARR